MPFSDRDDTTDSKRFVACRGELRGAGLSSVHLVTGWFREFE